LSFFVQDFEDTVVLGGTSAAYSAAHVEDGGEGSFVMEDTVNIAYRCPTPH
jgi:hypothetical protein